MAEARIVEVIKFGDKYFTYDDIVKIFTCHGRTYVGRIIHYADNGVQQYVKLDTSEQFESSDSIISISEIIAIEYAEEHYRRHVEAV